METITINAVISQGSVVEIPVGGKLYRINVTSVTDDARYINDRAHRYPHDVTAPVNA